MTSKVFNATAHTLVGLVIAAMLCLVAIEFVAGCSMDGKCVFLKEDRQ